MGCEKLALFRFFPVASVMPVFAPPFRIASVSSVFVAGRTARLTTKAATYRRSADAARRRWRVCQPRDRDNLLGPESVGESDPGAGGTSAMSPRR